MKKSLIKVVKKLFSKLGVEEIEGNNLVEVIDSGAEALPPVLPTPTDRDAGKCPVVKADGTYELSDAPFELPEVFSEDAGKGLFVDSNGTWGKEYPPRQVPQPDNDDDGKYLMVAGGEYVFDTPSGNDSDLFNIVVRKTGDDTWSIEQEWTDIMDAFNAGKYIIITLYPYYQTNALNFVRGFAKYEYSGFDRFMANIVFATQGPPAASPPYIGTYVVSIAWVDRLQSVNVSVDYVRFYGSASAT